jgi:putrescine transport system permease protein
MRAPTRRRRPPGGRIAIGLPYGWLIVFFFVPFLIVAVISFGESAISIPPYTAPLEFDDDWVPVLNVNLANYARLFGDSLYIKAYFNSLRMAATATLLCLLIGYPMAYAIARAPARWRNVLLMLVILPFWTSFLIRVYAWIGILKTNGLINNFLLAVGIIGEPLPLLNNAFSVGVALVYSYLPYMILPLYATLEKMDPALLEAAADLGSRPFRAFLEVTLPLSLPGIAAGCLLVFIPMVGEFVIPDLLGGPDTLMIGHVLWDEFFTNRDWPAAAAVAIAMLVFLVAPIAMAQRFLRGEAAPG